MTLEYECTRRESMRHYGFGTENMKKLKVCSFCGEIAESTGHNCKACGRLLPGETVFTQYRKRHSTCKRCDRILSEHMIYCPNCGTKLK